MPHLRPRIPFNSALLRFRSDVVSSLTEFFNSRQFVQTHTPILTSSDCEGAGEVFTVSAGDEKQQSNGGETVKSFFRRPVYTTVSAQLHLEALAQAVGNVWTLSPTFRAEQSDTPRHLSEFYMLEAEMSFTDDMNAVMDLVEDMLRHVTTGLVGSRAVADLSVRTAEGHSDLTPVEQVEKRWAGLAREHWPRITYTEAIDVLAASNEPFEHKAIWGQDLRTEHERYLAMQIGKGETPVFVTNYPRSIKAFYMKTMTDAAQDSSPGETVECFDLLVPDFCEIAGGSMREHRIDHLLESMRLRGMKPSPDPTSTNSDKNGPAEGNDLDWYLDLRRWGCPPHGGFGLGFDRLICYLSGVQTIRDTTAFPRWYGRCDC
jgi:asparaginyl-tRNA synthetase